jgi:hypothetical protein
MTKAIALSRTLQFAIEERQIDVLRAALVLSTATALIMAGQPLPF